MLKYVSFGISQNRPHLKVQGKITKSLSNAWILIIFGAFGAFGAGTKAKKLKEVTAQGKGSNCLKFGQKNLAHSCVFEVRWSCYQKKETIIITKYIEKDYQ
jgi:hypothetical protein